MISSQQPKAERVNVCDAGREASFQETQQTDNLRFREKMINNSQKKLNVATLISKQVDFKNHYWT